MMIPAFLLSPLVKYGIALALGASVVVGLYWKGHNDGSSTVRASVLEMDNAIAEAADDARRRVDRCFYLGGVWDATRGLCRSSVPRFP
jgi:hypothetical protein